MYLRRVSYETEEDTLSCSSLETFDSSPTAGQKSLLLGNRSKLSGFKTQRFCGERYRPGARSRVVTQKVQDLCWRWLKPEGWTRVEVAEFILVEQFAQIFPKGGRDWVLRHLPESLTDTVQLMENYLAAETALTRTSESLLDSKGTSRQKGELNQGKQKQDRVLPKAPAFQGPSQPSRLAIVRLQKVTRRDTELSSISSLSGNCSEDNRFICNAQSHWFCIGVIQERISYPSWRAQVTMQSSSAQVTMMESQDCKRAPPWTEREVRDLLAIWGDESVLVELRSSKRNGKILEKVSKAMKDRGHNRDAQQCYVKIKELRQAYHKAREANGRSGAEPQTCRFYAELHAILGGAATTTQTMCFDSVNGETRNREAGSGYAEDDDDDEDNEDSKKARIDCLPLI
uniref:SCAN box domain-containing protein n=1 Tax=Chrysemys picta bellii TaxID=8478 RepID=A0A8C3I3H5_CHRPI